MKPLKRPSHNFVYQGPTEEIGDLSVERYPEEGFVRSHWKPSAEELQMLNEGGSVELDIFAAPIPPVAVNVAPPVDGERAQKHRETVDKKPPV